MNKNMILMLCGAVIGGAVLGSALTMLLSKNSSGQVSNLMSLTEISSLSDKYLVKVEKYGISVEEFTNALSEVKKGLAPEQLAQFEANEALFNANVFESLINQTVVVASAIEEGFLENPENMKLFRNGVQQTLLNLYISQNAPTDPNAFAPSKAQIDQAFQQFGREFTARGLNASQAREYIVGQLSQQNRQRWTLEFMSKIREKYRIERNTKKLDEYNISMSPSGQMPIQ
ncbi:MAG: hypothetical protein ACRCS8_04920 [Brevinema sp.]